MSLRTVLLKIPPEIKTLGIGGLTVLLFISFVFVLPAQKRSLEPLIEEQVENLARLEEKYNFIIAEENRIGNMEKYIETPGEETPDVENWSGMKLLRTYASFYREAKGINEEIERLNSKINRRIKSPPLLFSSGKLRKVVRNTKKFNKKTKRFLEHKEKMNKLHIDEVSWNWDMGIYIVTLTQGGRNPIIVRQLRDRISKLAAQEKKYEPLDLENLDEDVKEEYEEHLEGLVQDNAVYNDLLPYLDKGDYWSLDRDLDAYLDSERGTLEADWQKRIEFWRTNKTVQAAGDIKEEWEKLTKDLD